MFVFTRNPRSFASAIASTALSKMPSRSTNWSCRSRMPSRCTTHAKCGDGSNRSIFFFIRIAFEQRKTNFLRLISSRVMTSTSGCTSGSPPAIDTIGAPDSSIASSACCTGIRFLRISFGYWIFPQNEHARLHWKSGSSSTSSGNLSFRLMRCFAR